MTVIRQDKGYWQTGYTWSQRGGKWTDLTDVMLGGTADNPRCAQALEEWVDQQDKDQAKVDGIGREIFYAGGVPGYLDWSHGQAGDSCTIFLHSHGQDAFDSLSHYPREVVDFVHARGCTGLSWAEARHDRPDHRLEWP